MSKTLCALFFSLCHCGDVSQPSAACALSPCNPSVHAIDMHASKARNLDALRSLPEVRFVDASDNPLQEIGQWPPHLAWIDLSGSLSPVEVPRGVVYLDKEGQLHAPSSDRQADCRLGFAETQVLSCERPEHGVAAFRQGQSETVCGIDETASRRRPCRHPSHGWEPEPQKRVEIKLIEFEVKHGTRNLDVAEQASRKCEQLKPTLDPSLKVLRIHDPVFEQLGRKTNSIRGICRFESEVQVAVEAVTAACPFEEKIIATCRDAAFGVESYHKLPNALCGYARITAVHPVKLAKNEVCLSCETSRNFREYLECVKQMRLVPMSLELRRQQTQYFQQNPKLPPESAEEFREFLDLQTGRTRR